MSSTSWQHPFVNIFKHFDVNSSKKCAKQGDVSAIMDRDLKSTVYRIRGLVPANNYIQFPSHPSNGNLSLTGRLFYILFRPIYDKYFCIHVDILTHEQHLIRISLSNLYREFKVTQTSIQFPYMTTGSDIHWSVLCLDLHLILLTYLTNQHFHLIKSFQLSGNIFVKNCFSSQFLYEPGIDNDTAKRTGLTHAGILSLPRELSYPIGKGESWHDKYDFIMFPNTSSLVGKNQNEPFDKVGNVRLPTPRKLKSNDENLAETESDHEFLPVTAQTTLINGQISRSITDLAHITQRSVSPGDNQLNWRTYNNPVDRFPSLPTIDDAPLSSHKTDDGIHLFVNPQTIPSSTSITDDSNYDLALTADRPRSEHLSTLLPDPILRLHSVIGLNTSLHNLLWTLDGNYVLYSASAVVVQMHIETRQQWFFIGHTDQVSAMAFDHHSSLLATVQTGQNAILRLWKFETRRCLCATRVINTYDLHALDLGIANASASVVIVGRDEQSRTVVCVYNASKASKGTVELISRATTNVSISHIRFVPHDITKFLSIGPDNIRFWRLKNENDLQSISLSENHLDQLEYTDLQFDHSAKNQSSEVVVYITTRTGQILEILYDERLLVRVHHLSEKVIKNLTLSTLTCTHNFAITGSHDGYVRVWSGDFSQVYIEAKYDQSIVGLIASTDQTRILILTASGSLNMLNLVSKVHLNLMRAHTNSITDIDYDNLRKQMISVGEDGTIRVWCFRTGKQLSEFISEKEVPSVVVYTPDREIFACGFNNGTIKIFDWKTSMILHELKYHQRSITGLLYSYNGSSLLSGDEEGALCLSDADNKYKLQKNIANALRPIEKGPAPLSISPDGKYTVYVGPTEFIVTTVETNTLNQTLRLDISSCTYVTADQRTITSSESALFARFTPSRHLLVATKNFKLLKFDSYSGKLLTIIDNMHKYSFETLALSSNSQYLITGGDQLLKFWDANMELDVNYQNFIGHSKQVRKVFFTDDNMHVISIGDAIFIWDVLAWSKSQPAMLNDARCIAAPQSVMTKVLENTSIRLSTSSSDVGQMNENTARMLTRSNIEKIESISSGEKKVINQKLLTKQNEAEHASLSPSSSRRHFIQRTNHSQLAKRRYVAPANQESLKLQSIIGYNGNGRDNLVWYPHTGFFAYTVTCNIIVENLTSNDQTILSGHTEEISTMALSNDGAVLASAQCSIVMKQKDFQAKIIIWETKTLRQKLVFHQSVQAVQSMAFSKDDRFLATVGNHRKAMLTLWSTKDYSHVLNWQDDFSSSYLNCLAWNPLRTNEFCLGGSHGLIHFCTIGEPADDTNLSLHVVKGELPSLLNEHTKSSSDITTCVYLNSTANLVLCATNYGFITCWNSRLCLCILHWKVEMSEICYLATINEKLLTGSTSGCLKLWNLQNLERNLGQVNSTESNYGLTIEDEFQLDDGIISGSFDNTFDMGLVGTLSGSIWYICWRTDRSNTRLLASHTEQITDVLPIEETHLVTSSLDGTIRVFQIDDRNEILRFNADGLKVTCLASWENPLHPKNERSHSNSSPIKNMKTTIRSIIAGYDDGSIRVFHLLQGEMTLKLQAHAASVTAIHVPSHTTICLSGASDGSVAICNLVEGLLLRVVHEHRGPVPICAIDSKKSAEKNAYLWLIVSHDRRVSLWKSNQQFTLCSLIDWLTFSAPDATANHWQSSPPSLARFLDTSAILYTGYGIEKCLQIYNIDSKEVVRTIPLNHWCYSLDLSSTKTTDRLIAMGTKERLLQLKDYTQESFQDFLGHSDRIATIKFNQSNDLLITTSANEIFVWKIGSN